MIKLFEEFGETKVLNYCNAGYGQIFWDQDNKIICAIHENDGEFRSEYMTGMFEHFGIEVRYHKVTPEFVKEWDSYEDYGY